MFWVDVGKGLILVDIEQEGKKGVIGIVEILCYTYCGL